MEDARGGFEQIALAIMEMHQRTEALLAENRQLQAELAALRQGAGIIVAVEGRLFLLVPEQSAPTEPPSPLR